MLIINFVAYLCGSHVFVCVCRQQLVKLIDEYEAGTISWKSFESQVRKIHRSRTGAPHFRQVGEFPKFEENFYSNPYPGCICKKEAESRRLLRRRP